MSFGIEDSHKSLETTNKDVAEFQVDYNQMAKKLSDADKSKEFTMLGGKANEVKDDTNKNKTILLVRENKFKEVNTTKESELAPQGIGKVFDLLQTIYQFEYEINDS